MLQDPFLSGLQREQIPSAIFLVNGIKLQGTVDGFDQFVILLKALGKDGIVQMIYKHASSTTVPSRPVNMDTAEMDLGKGRQLQEPFLNACRREHVPVAVYLVNGIKLQGQVESFDQYVVLLKNTVTQMVYKHAISTVVPSRPVAITANDCK